MEWAETVQFLGACLPAQVRDELALLRPGELREVRIRAGRRAVLCTAERQAAVDWTPDAREVALAAEALSGHSLYARCEETGRGFVTLAGGHRMGLCGQAVHRGGRTELTHIGSACIRIAAQWPGAADALMPLVRRGSGLIIGTPGSGKTTLLRDLARQLGSGRGARQVALVDERGELAACVGGAPQLDVGEWTDVLDGLPKAEAIEWLLRAMTPQVLITDELAGAEDAAAVLDAAMCGVTVLASVHGSGLDTAASRPALAQLMARRCFAWYAVLSPEGGAQAAAMYDRTGAPMQRS